MTADQQITDGTLAFSLRRVMGGSAWLLWGQGITFLSGIYVVALLSRLLGPEGYGQYVLATSIVLTFRGLVIFGADQIAVREVAAGRMDADRLLSCLFTVRLVVGGLAFLGAGVFARLLGMPAVVCQGVWVYGLVLFFQGPISFALSLRARLIMWPLFVQMAVRSAFWVAAVTVLARLGAGPVDILWAGVAAGAVSCAVIVALSLKSVRPRIRLNLGEAWWLARQAAPLFAESLLIGLIVSLPIWLLARSRSPADAALFAAPMRIVLYLCFIPSVLAQCILPALSGRLGTDRTWARRLYVQFLWAMTAIGVVLGGAVLLNASRIVMLLFGEEFMQGVPILRTLTVLFIATCVGIGGHSFSVALGRQKVNLFVVAVQLVVFAVPALALRMGPLRTAIWMTATQCAAALFWVLFAATFAASRERKGSVVERAAPSRRERPA